MGEYRVIKEEFKTISQLLETMNRRENNKIMRAEHASRDGSKEFCGTASWTEAINMLPIGYLAVMNKLKSNMAVQKKLNSKFVASIERPTPHNAIVGYIPNVPNAIRNMPDSMISIDRKPMKRKTIHILYSNGGNCGKSTDWFIKAGTALLTAVDIIERGGIQTKIDIAFMTSRAGNEITFPTINIKNYGERFSLQKTSFPLVHPSMFRRIGFKWLETTPEITSSMYSCGYGQSPSIETIRKNVSVPSSTYILSAEEINGELECSVEKILQKLEMI